MSSGMLFCSPDTTAIYSREGLEDTEEISHLLKFRSIVYNRPLVVVNSGTSQMRMMTLQGNIRIVKMLVSPLT